MEVKNLIIPALCIIGTMYAMKGCECEKKHTSCRSYTPPQPVPVYQEPVQVAPDYQEVYEQPAQTRIIRRRVIRRTIQQVPTSTYYYEY